MFTLEFCDAGWQNCHTIILYSYKFVYVTIDYKKKKNTLFKDITTQSRISKKKNGR